ncbi:AmmeMemoRadiSam system protein A [Shewanella sp. AS16]|uniref:AmmeMemoRadiSam system protein A n=1 Tax=Shewanella sp. AS16 TaxID=2907625 RepID=UPI001F443E67|nr:AmmeMemoRadiSam system protein A [Shewanella sp. AS16]MCE9686146.1 AmmeMemoRadiSam system protein A [Shewanella sp. AS16]
MPASPWFELGPEAREELKSLVWRVLHSALAQDGSRRLVLPPAPESPALLQPAATFVTLHHKGELRGCIGSTQADTQLWQDACEHAYGSAFEDRRFPPLRKHELKHLSVEISILSALQPLENLGEQALLATLRPGIDGLLLHQYGRRALFLPSVWDALPEPETFLQALKYKGGWPPDYWDSTIEIARFQTLVVR